MVSSRDYSIQRTLVLRLHRRNHRALPPPEHVRFPVIRGPHFFPHRVLRHARFLTPSPPARSRPRAANRRLAGGLLASLAHTLPDKISENTAPSKIRRHADHSKVFFVRPTYRLLRYRYSYRPRYSSKPVLHCGHFPSYRSIASALLIS